MSKSGPVLSMQPDQSRETSEQAQDVAMTAPSQTWDGTPAETPDSEGNIPSTEDFVPKFEQTDPANVLVAVAGESGPMADANKPKSPQQHKKKGTAKVVKPRKGGKAGGPAKRKTGGASAKKKKTAGAAADGADSEGALHGGDAEEDGSVAGDDGSESDQGTYCICHGPDDHRFMISCDSCSDWFHGNCVGMDKETGEKLVQQYVCPRCEEPRVRFVTRYKKLCALPGCDEPARIYNAKDPSVFCGKLHCDQWWETMIGRLPKGKAGAVVAGDVLTQADFVGLLDRQGQDGAKHGAQWKLGEKPFTIKPSFWDQVPLEEALTAEELVFVTASSADRRALQQEIVLCKKQLQLLDMAAERRKQLILAAGTGANKDMCGYDYNLDAVGSSAAFAAFDHSARGQAIFAAGSLDPPMANEGNGETKDAVAWEGSGPPPNAAGDWTCRARRCKPHGAWYNSMVKSVRHTMKQLAAEAKEKHEAEMRVQDCAAVRYQRRPREANWVEEIMDTD
jgi:COMPASS component SPP1